MTIEQAKKEYQAYVEEVGEDHAESFNKFLTDIGRDMEEE